jgi:lipoprotein-releasing system ATP-binding protein
VNLVLVATSIWHYSLFTIIYSLISVTCIFHCSFLIFHLIEMIDIKNITKSFGSLQVLKGIDLHIDKGEVVSIVGPSGAGKTTLLQIMGTLDKADTGTVIVDGVAVNELSGKKLSDFRNQHIGFVFQFHQLLPEFTALENIMIPAFIAGKSKKEAKARAEELLAFMGLADRASHKPAELSGGEKQRVAVARALVNNPAVIFADEPSGSLDTKNKAELHQLFFDLRDKFGQTFVIVTHDEGLSQITDRCIHLKDGVIYNNEENTVRTEESAESGLEG